MSSNAEWCKNIEKSADFLKKEHQRVCQYRALRTEDQIEKDRNAAKIRMRLYRQRMRNAETKPRGKNPVITTRHRADNQREKWRLYKRSYRAKLSNQKKRCIREAERAKYDQKRNSNKILSSDESGSEESPYGKFAERKAIYRAKKTVAAE